MKYVPVRVYVIKHLRDWKSSDLIYVTNSRVFKCWSNKKSVHCLSSETTFNK